MGVCEANAFIVMSGEACPSQSQVSVNSSMSCVSTSYNGATCTWVGNQCSYNGVTGGVFMDLTTCAPSAVTISPYLTPTGQVRCKAVRWCLTFWPFLLAALDPLPQLCCRVEHRAHAILEGRFMSGPCVHNAEHLRYRMLHGITPQLPHTCE